MIGLVFLKILKYEYNSLIAYYHNGLNKVILFNNFLNDFAAIFEFCVFFFVWN